MSRPEHGEVTGMTGPERSEGAGHQQALSSHASALLRERSEHGKAVAMTGPERSEGAGHQQAQPGRAGASLRERAEPCGVAT
jgi:hypothetical protein